MYILLLTLFFIISISLILIILIQNNKGGILSSSESNSSATLFGSSGSKNFIFKIIVFLGILFFLVSLLLGNIIKLKNKKNIINKNLNKSKVFIKKK